MSNLVIDPAKLNPSKNGSIAPYTVGEDVKAGMPVYRDPKTTAIRPASSAAAGAAAEVFGIALSNQVAGQKSLVVKRDPELFLGVDGLQPGDVLVLGTEPGSIIKIEDRQPGTVTTVLAVVDAKGLANFVPLGSRTASPAAKPANPAS